MHDDHELEDVRHVLVDGDNLLHAVRGSRDEGGVAWLLPRLARWRPDEVDIVVALDGHPATGEVGRRRVGRGVEFRHSGSRSGDDLIIELLTARPYGERAATLVVTRDRDLLNRARREGGRTRSVDWLMRQLAGDTGTSTMPSKPVGIGAGRRPRSRHFDPPTPGEEDRTPWQSGRGATKKRGNPKRKAKHERRR